MLPKDDEDDEAFLQALIRPEEDRQRLHPELPWRGGYRWFRSTNVVCLEQARRRHEALSKAKRRP